MPRGTHALILPQRPRWLPGELLGGWLATTAADNAITTKTALFEIAKVDGPRHQYGIADFIGKTDFLLKAAETFGCSRGDAVQRLSTRPYHLCFDRLDRRPAVAGDETSPDDVAYFSRRMLRICPICVALDFKELGRPYFHRSHQLLGTHVCHLHGANLLMRCPQCGISIRLNTELPLVPLRCTCGWDFRQAGEPRSPDDPWWRLAIFEHESLALPPGTLSVQVAEPALKAILSDKFTNSGRYSPLRALAATFGDRGLMLLRRALSDPQEVLATIPKSIHIPDIRAPLIGALFVAAGCTLTEALHLVNQMHPELAKEPERVAATPRRRSARPKDTEQARTLLEAALESGTVRTRANVRDTMRFTFWLLFLFDGDWFLRRLPPLRGDGMINVPSIGDDRACLEEAWEGEYSYRRIEARVRAYYRDREWLSTLILVPQYSERTKVAQTMPRWRFDLPQNVAEAREQLVRSIKEYQLSTRTLIRARRPHVFWLLTLEDPEWFRRTLPFGPGSDLVPVPPIAEDRAQIGKGEGKGRAHSEARIRAFYRDRAWLDRLIGERLENARTAEGDQMAARLRSARAAFTSRPGRPERWTTRAAASAIGQSPSTILRFAEWHPECGAALNEELAEHLRRLISWGIKDCERRGEPLRLKGLYKNGWSVKSHRHLAWSILGELLNKT